jgi:hypothetical protein
MVLWDTFLTQISTAFGINDVTVAGYVLSLIITLAFVTTIAVTTRGRLGSTATAITGYGFLIFFTVAGWMDAWVLILIVVGTAGIYAILAKGLLS